MNKAKKNKPRQPREKQEYLLTEPVYFIGFMGAGKSSVARRLARFCGLAAVDMDTYIERSSGKKVKDIFAEEGEEAFRNLETEAIAVLSRGDHRLISCGGGVVIRPQNRTLLRECGYVVYLQVTADEAASRISDFSTRPLFNDIDGARELVSARMPWYEQAAHLTVDTAGRSVGRIAGSIQNKLLENGILVTAS